jgi:hypothetical protein
VNPLIAALPVIAITLVAIGVVAVAWTLLSGNSTSSSGPSVAESPVSGTPSGSASGKPSASSTASASPSSSASARIDRSIPVTITNATEINGLAGKAKAKLVAVKWDASVSYESGTPGLPTMIYYGTSSQSATAQQVADDLGVGTVKKSSIHAVSGIAVVVGDDFAALTGSAG